MPQAIGFDNPNSNPFDGVPTEAVVYVPRGSRDAYSSAPGWDRFTDIREIGSLKVSLSETAVSLAEGETATVAFYVEHDGEVWLQGIECGSSDSSVAWVDFGEDNFEELKITALRPGVAEIYFKAEDGFGFSCMEICTVTVNPPIVLAESITLDRTEVEATEGEEIQLTATVLPDNATDRSVVWTSSDETVATVSADGLVKVHRTGTCVITAATADGTDLKAECLISPRIILAESITLDITEAEAAEGDEIQLTATVLPDNATDRSVVWTSSDETVATVSADGLVKVHRAGTCVITAATADGTGLKAECLISPRIILAESIMLDRTEVEATEGEEIQLTATVLPDNTTDKRVDWSSSDEWIATVNADGLVKIHKSGTCVITAATADGTGLKAECLISVISGIEEIFGESPLPVDVYTLDGLVILRSATPDDLDTLARGIYIIRKRGKHYKVVVK